MSLVFLLGDFLIFNMTENCQSHVEGKWQTVSLITGDTQLFIFTVKPTVLLQESISSSISSLSKGKTHSSPYHITPEQCGLTEQHPHVYPAAQEQAAGNSSLPCHPSFRVGDLNSLFLSLYSQDWRRIRGVQWSWRQSWRLGQLRGIPSSKAKGTGRFVHSSAYTTSCSSQW